MNPSFWETLGNFFLFVLWFRIWTRDDRGLMFNRYLLPLGRLTDRIVAFLRPVFFGASDRVILAVTIAFLVCFRAAFVSPAVPWEIMIGPETYTCGAGSVLSCIVFSAVSLALLLFRLWGLSLIYVGYGHPRGHAGEAAYCLTRPFSDIKHGQRPFVLLGLGIGIVLLCRLTAAPPPDEATAAQVLARAIVAILMEWVNLLPAISGLLLLMIIGSWIAAFTGSSGLRTTCREWMDLLLGPLRGRPVRLGLVDLTPLILVFVLSYVYAILYQDVLVHLYKRI